MAMCDIILATPPTTAARSMLFGKNSDRQRNESQIVELIQPADHASEAQLACTYITIPQAARSHAVLLCRPFWTWGAEMGANEFGVAIGNEGLHARSPEPQTEALTGMDLVRLALERAVDAAQAVDVITLLLERHGQGGNCGHLLADYYNNSFMIADPRQAFVLETVGRQWCVERVDAVRSLSNGYSIKQQGDRASEGMPELIRSSGWSADPRPSFADVVSNPIKEHLGHAQIRSARSGALLKAREGCLEIADMMRILRDHGPEAEKDRDWHPGGASARTICLHAAGADRRGQTVGSLVSQLAASGAVHWVTGTAAPCLSIFKPVLMDVPLPSHGPLPAGRFDPHTLWWRHEQLHRGMLGGFSARFSEIAEERDMIEGAFRSRISAVLAEGTAEDRAQVVAACWDEAEAAEDRWVANVDPTNPPGDGEYRAAWREMNALAGIPT